MNYIKHLTAFYEKVAQDDMLNPSHISLYLALFQFWNFSRFRYRKCMEWIEEYLLQEIVFTIEDNWISDIGSLHRELSSKFLH